MSGSPFRFDSTNFPVLVLTCPRSMDEASVASLADGLERVLDRREKFVMICDTRGTGVPSALVRKQLAEVMNRKSIRDRQAQYQLGSANIIESVPIRAALTALLWLWTPPNPMTSVGSMAEAAAWAIEKLSAANVPVPAAVRVLAQERRTG